jgi:hypothetical protein
MGIAAATSAFGGKRLEAAGAGQGPGGKTKDPTTGAGDLDWELGLETGNW